MAVATFCCTNSRWIHVCSKKPETRIRKALRRSPRKTKRKHGGSSSVDRLYISADFDLPRLPRRRCDTCRLAWRKITDPLSVGPQFDIEIADSISPVAITVLKVSDCTPLITIGSRHFPRIPAAAAPPLFFELVSICTKVPQVQT